MIPMRAQHGVDERRRPRAVALIKK